MPTSNRWPLLAVWTCLTAPNLLGSAAYAATGAEIFAAWQKDPGNHPNIPDVSYAGYSRGEKPLPNPAVVANVRTEGAKGDGQADDTEAFKKAIAAAAAKGGAVLVPAGTYKVSSFLRLDTGVVLRGEGPTKSVIKFTKSLNDILGTSLSGTSSRWSWAGALIWIGPADTFESSGTINYTPRPMYWESWRIGAALTAVTVEAVRGTTKLTVQDGTKLKKGETVVLVWDSPTDLSLVKEVYGHAATANAYKWDTAKGITGAGHPTFNWPIDIADVKGNEVTLAQPIRIDVRKAFNVRFATLGSHLSETGIEHLKLELSAPYEHEHLKNVGWNGVYFNRVVNGFARDLEIASAENPLILAAAKNVTVTGVKLSGEAMNHHSFACRESSHDNLFEKFFVEGPHRVHHGINTEYFSSGNVWSKGVQNKGTFDSHRAISFDSVRTEMTTASDKNSGPGGADDAGPFVGRRIVHWNVNIKAGDRTKPGEFVNQPRALSMGALVGVRGVPLDNTDFYDTWMPPGDKGTIVADDGLVPQPTNLYEAQLKQRGFQPQDHGSIPTTTPTADGGIAKEDAGVAPKSDAGQGGSAGQSGKAGGGNGGAASPAGGLAGMTGGGGSGKTGGGSAGSGLSGNARDAGGDNVESAAATGCSCDVGASGSSSGSLILLAGVGLGAAFLRRNRNRHRR